MKTRKYQLSFGGGELSREMFGRIDTRQNQTGAARLRNWIVTPQGSLIRRPGSQYVYPTHITSRRSRLLPFKYSTDQSLCVEVSEGAFRFFSNGVPVRWASPYPLYDYDSWDSATVINNSTGVFTFPVPHGLANNAAVYVTTTQGDPLPTELSYATTYYVEVLNATQIRLGTGSGPTSIITSYTAGHSGVTRLFLAADMPQLFVTSKTVTWDIVTDVVNCTGHGLENGNVVRFTSTLSTGWPKIGTGAARPWVGPDIDYYVVEATANSFGITRDPKGTTKEPLSNTVSGTHTVYRRYKIGDLITLNSGSIDEGVYSCRVEHSATTAPSSTANWYTQRNDGVLRIANSYVESDLPDIHYCQSNDVMTLVHPSYPPAELLRLGAAKWAKRDIEFSASIDIPTGVTVTADRGAGMSMESVAANGSGDGLYIFTSKPLLEPGDIIYLDSVSASGYGVEAGNYYMVNEVDAGLRRLTLRDIDTGDIIANSLGTATVTGTWYYASLSTETTQSYKVTAVDANGAETAASAEGSGSNILENIGASNLIEWQAVFGADKYRIYKELNGVYGFIGESESDSFTDDNIIPDLSATAPIADDSLSGTDYPRAVAYFQQRRVFGGTDLEPRTLWMTKSGTESDLSYSIPLQDDDRIKVTIAAREAHTIRHIVPGRQMVIMSQLGEFSLAGTDTDAITPASAGTVPHSYIGANNVQPVVVNNTVVFGANRGGHVRELGYNWQAQGYVTGDLSLRAAHLFDGETVDDLAYVQAPYPIVVGVSSRGDMPALTYVPEEQIGAWGLWDTDGTVVSCCAVPEGDTDSIYLCVERNTGGGLKHFIERIQISTTQTLEDAVNLDWAHIYDGTGSSSVTLRATGGVRWIAGESVTITASDWVWTGSADIGNDVELRDEAGTGYRARITAVTTGKVVTCRLLADLPTELRGQDAASWAYAKKVITGLYYPDGTEVMAVADGAPAGYHDVVGESITLTAPATRVVIGLNYTSELQTMPLSLEMEAGSQGRNKNVNQVWVRVKDTAGLKIGQTVATARQSPDLPITRLSSVVADSRVTAEWDHESQLVVVQDQPLPATVLSMTIEVSIGD